MAENFEGMRLVSEQIDIAELRVLMRELRKVLAAGVQGDVVELGCYEGTTSLFLQKELAVFKDKKLWLYDSFEGLPEKSAKDASPAGLQFRAGELHADKRRLIANFKKAGLPVPKIKKGWFSDLKEDDLPPSICFAFLDGDFYDSTLDSLRLVWPRMSRGGLIAVDDYANESLPGAHRAVDVWLKTHKAKSRVEKSLAFLLIE